MEEVGAAVPCTPVFLFPSPWPPFLSSLLVPFTEHFPMLYPDAYSIMFSLSSRNARGSRSRSNMHPNRVLLMVKFQTSGALSGSIWAGVLRGDSPRVGF